MMKKKETKEKEAEKKMREEKRLVHSLRLRQSIPTILQSLGCIAQHSILTSEAQEIACHILEEIFQVTDVGMPNELNLLNRTSKCSSPCIWMIYALKALVRSFLPDRRRDVNRRIDDLLDIIEQLLQMGSFADKSVLCDAEKGKIRLAAAKSVLRLSRKWDLHISPLIFRLTVLMAKDNDPEVRRLFLNKVEKLAKVHNLPSRYACAFSFAASDSEEDLRENALKSMEEFLRAYDKAAQLYQSSAKLQSLINHPVYMVVFLLHVVAHSSNFPPTECRDEEVYVPIFSPLLFTIQALVKANFANGGMSISHRNALSLRSIFIAIRRAEDAIDALVTPKLHTLADFGISVLNALQCNSASMSQNTELILLPSSLYKMSLTEEIETCKTSLSHNTLDESFIMNLICALGIQISQTPNEHDKQFDEDSLVVIPNKCNESNFSLFKRVDTSASLMKEQHKNPNSYQELHETLCQDMSARGPKNQTNSSFSSEAVKWHNEFPIDEEHEEASNRASRLIRSEKLPYSDTTTRRSVLDQREDLSSPSKEVLIKNCTSNITNPSLCTRAKHVNLCTSTAIDDYSKALTGKRMKLWSSTQKCDLGKYNSVRSERERLVASGGNSAKENRDFHSRRAPQTVSIKKVQNPQNDDVNLSAPKIKNVNEDAIARRLTRQKNMK